ncbi:hypothetical protein Tco_0154077 [Tanacetum coccineum]
MVSSDFSLFPAVPIIALSSKCPHSSAESVKVSGGRKRIDPLSPAELYKAMLNTNFRGCSTVNIYPKHKVSAPFDFDDHRASLSRLQSLRRWERHWPSPERTLGNPGLALNSECWIIDSQSCMHSFRVMSLYLNKFAVLARNPFISTGVTIGGGALNFPFSPERKNSLVFSEDEKSIWLTVAVFCFIFEAFLERSVVALPTVRFPD